MLPDLTLEALQALYDQLRGVLYYGTLDTLTPGKVLMQEAKPGWPAAIYCHPDDLEELRKRIPQRLVHLREWRMTVEDSFAYSDELITPQWFDRPPTDVFVMRSRGIKL